MLTPPVDAAYSYEEVNFLRNYSANGRLVICLSLEVFQWENSEGSFI